MHPKTVLVALALIAGVCSPSHAQKNKEKGQESKAVAVQAAKTVPAKGGTGAKESGTLPSVFVVNTALDAVDWFPGDGACETGPGSGECTLRAAVMESNSGDGNTINFEPTLFGTPQTIVLMGQLEIIKTMTINGPGADKLSISGDDATRIL